MIIGISDEILKIHSLGLLGRLLADKTTGANIIWATDAYKAIGAEYGKNREIRASLITGSNAGVIKNRARKALEEQNERTKRNAEVFTPMSLCRKMNDAADEALTGAPGLFFDEKGFPRERVEFPQTKRKTPEWQRYVDFRALEITCGEAPYLASRYDVSTGEYIEIRRRIGVLDRKLRVVNENAHGEAEWLKWALRAFCATYGYELQGDNLLIARINLLMTFDEYLTARLNRKPTQKEYKTAANVIAWNVWQMDGLTGKVPARRGEENFRQLTLFDDAAARDADACGGPPNCRVYDWRGKRSVEYLSIGS